MDRCENEVIPEEELQELVLEPIMISTDNLVEMEFDEEEFKKGLKEISFMCGQLTGLINVGLSPSDALAFLTDKEVLKNNLKVSEMNKETSIEVAKNTAIQVEKNSL